MNTHWANAIWRESFCNGRRFANLLALDRYLTAMTKLKSHGWPVHFNTLAN